MPCCWEAFVGRRLATCKRPIVIKLGLFLGQCKPINCRWLWHGSDGSSAADEQACGGRRMEVRSCVAPRSAGRSGPERPTLATYFLREAGRFVRKLHNDREATFGKTVLLVPRATCVFRPLIPWLSLRWAWAY